MTKGIALGLNALNRARPNPNPVLTSSTVLELHVHGDVVPLQREALELRWDRSEMHPGANRHRLTVRSRGLLGEANFDRREPYGAWSAGDLLGAGGHLLIYAV